MIIEFSVENYRSFKDKCTLSMVAESSKSKIDNVFEHTMANGETVRLLKSAVLYGANASGKSNLLKALQSLCGMVKTLSLAGENIKWYEPFLFDSDTQNAPTKFTLSFIGPSNYKYNYHIAFNSHKVLEEKLDYFPKSQSRNLFTRTLADSQNSLIHTVKLGQDFRFKHLKVIKNQTVISKFGSDEPDEFFTPVYLYFINELTIFGGVEQANSRELVEEKIYQSLDLQNNLSRLLKISDTKIKDVIIKKNEPERYSMGGLFAKSKPLEDKKGRYELFGKHSMYSNDKWIKDLEMPFDEESKGTNVLFVLGAEILDKLEKGGVFFVDEIDTSLHPMLAKFLVMLFQNPKSNLRNAQLIFTTHETTFLDKDIFRKDQIWFTEKNEYGVSELLSVQDFDNVREDTPFEKWYLAGKFGGIPNIKEIEFIFPS